MLAPIGAPNLAEAVPAGSEIYGKLKKLLADKGFATGLGDEGGFAPEIDVPEDVLSLLMQAIEDAGYRAGRDGVAVALDPAASEFYRDGRYHVAGEALSSDDMIVRFDLMTRDFAVWSIEDGLAESDWDGWARLTERLGSRVQLVGDDVLVTNPAIIREGIEKRIANAALIKLNQVGSVSETVEAMRLCREAGWAAMVSHRSGETEDSFIADLAVGSGCGQRSRSRPRRSCPMGWPLVGDRRPRSVNAFFHRWCRGSPSMGSPTPGLDRALRSPSARPSRPVWGRVARRVDRAMSRPRREAFDLNEPLTVCRVEISQHRPDGGHHRTHRQREPVDPETWVLVVSDVVQA